MTDCESKFKTLREVLEKTLRPLGWDCYFLRPFKVHLQFRVDDKEHVMDGQLIASRFEITTEHLRAIPESAIPDYAFSVFAKKAVFDAMALLHEAELPYAPEQDWRPTETIPEDLYA